MKNKWFAFMAVLYLCFVQASSADPVSGYKIVNEWTGVVSKIENDEYYRITDVAAWRELWKRYAPDASSAPEVDFKSYMAVGIFYHTETQREAVKIVDIAEAGEAIDFSYEVPGYQALEYKYVKPVHPFGIFIIPYSPKKLVLTERVSHPSGTVKQIVTKEFQRISNATTAYQR